MASLIYIYDRFTKQPNTDDLDDSATLSYISSGTNVTGAGDILRLLARVRSEVQVTEDVLAYHSGQNSLTLEVAAECKFKNGPGWIAPGVDGNLVDDVEIKFPLVKTVVFTGDKIRSIRVYWDQATVLKQLNIVGSRGRGWPITDGPNQIDLISKTVVSTGQPKTRAREEQINPTSTNIPSVSVTAPEKPKPNPVATPRRTYSIANDDDFGFKETPKRLPRAGWENHHQRFNLSEEGDVPLKEQSPVRLPRAGQAPKREFSFSNLSEAYKAQETPIKRPQPEEEAHQLLVPKPFPSIATSQIFEGKEEDIPKPKAKSRPVRETIYHDLDTTPKAPVKPSIGGGIGGRRPEETIFFELEEDNNPTVKPKKTPITRRDQQTHFSFTDEDPRIPPPKNSTGPQQFEATLEPHEDEYHERALQKKEVNHFRPDTVSHFEIVDFPEDEMSEQPKANSEEMKKLLKNIEPNWRLETGSPPKEPHRMLPPKKGLTPHFSFSGSPEKSDEEKENGQAKRASKQYGLVKSVGNYRLRAPVKSEEKGWWEM